MPKISDPIWKAIAAVLAALAFILNGHTDPQALGTFALAIVSALALLQSHESGHIPDPAQGGNP